MVKCLMEVSRGNYKPIGQAFYGNLLFSQTESDFYVLFFCMETFFLYIYIYISENVLLLLRYSSFGVFF